MKSSESDVSVPEKASETELVKAVLKSLGSRYDTRVWRNNTGRLGRVSFGLKGSADIIGIVKSVKPGCSGTFLAVELKTAKGKQSVAQESFQGMIERMGGVYILVKADTPLEAVTSSNKQLDQFIYTRTK